ncbi:hypothetical protein [Nocardia sp. NPDC056000]|uniref:hypothetical protein n=1 Tax=Nocardia sp. NPDC056000 TaxID=3345674 RepID=UPI0035D8C48A
MTHALDGYGFDEIPLAATALAGQLPDRLTSSKAAVIQTYTCNAHDDIMWRISAIVRGGGE